MHDTHRKQDIPTDNSSPLDGRPVIEIDPSDHPGSRILTQTDARDEHVFRGWLVGPQAGGAGGPTTVVLLRPGVLGGR